MYLLILIQIGLCLANEPIYISRYSSDFTDYIGTCKPAEALDGQYCGTKRDGWFNGGFACEKNQQSCLCSCANAGTSCQDKRCPDSYTSFYSEEGKGMACFLDDSTGRKYSNYIYYDFCYKNSLKCDYNQCNYAESLSGCGKDSAGTCKACTPLVLDHFWRTKSSCDQILCSPIMPGMFLGAECTYISNRVSALCASYPGNPLSVLPSDRATYYCPGGGLVLPLPENSEPNLNYSGYVCSPGYYLLGSSCPPCEPGYACKYGKKFKCPTHYYTSASAQSECKLCSKPDSCVDSYPVRCLEGSTSNVGCVMCGGCDYDPRRGLSCVTEIYEMQGLPNVWIGLGPI
jgi:hypothetical protein